MRMQFFGDSYDVVKRFLLCSVAPGAEWVAFPMFTDDATADDVRALESFLGVRVVAPTPLSGTTDRAQLFSALADHRNVFLDPDTGIKLERTNGVDSVKYVFASELIALCKESPERLLLVFDQSVPRGGEEAAIEKKLAHFRTVGIHGFAYLSHACFVVLSATKSHCETAKNNLLTCGLPNSRLL